MLTVPQASASWNPAVAAVILVHLGGRLGPVRELQAWCREVGAVLIEDCAQAAMSSIDGQKAGTFGRFGCFSFQQGKTMSAGEGGAVVCDREEDYLRLQELRTDGRIYSDPPKAGLMQVRLGSGMGVNRCMSEIQAAILLDQLERLDELLQREAEGASRLDLVFSQMDGWRSLRPTGGTVTVSLYEYAVQYTASDIETVQSVLDAAKGTGGDFAPVQLPLHRSDYYRPRKHPRFSHVALGGAHPARVAFPGSDLYASRTISFHHGTLLATESLNALVEALSS